MVFRFSAARYSITTANLFTYLPLSILLVVMYNLQSKQRVYKIIPFSYSRHVTLIIGFFEINSGRTHTNTNGGQYSEYRNSIRKLTNCIIVIGNSLLFSRQKIFVWCLYYILLKNFLKKQFFQQYLLLFQGLWFGMYFSFLYGLM